MFKAVFLTSLLAVVMAQNLPRPTCFGGGAVPATDCTPFIRDFCADVAKTQYRVGNAGSACFSLSNGNRCDFVAFNSRNVLAAPSEVNCNLVLNNVARTCATGGYGQPGPNGYTFAVDLNVGRCVPGVQCGS